MKTKSIITTYPQTVEQVNAIKAFMKALKIKFDISKVEDKPYDPEFVEKIQESQQQYEEGKFSSINDEEELKNLLGID